MKRLVYADNAATTKLAPAALEAMLPFLQDEYGNASQPYSFARAARKALRKSREVIADCIGARPEEIFFTSCGTESDNWVLKGCAFSARGPGAVRIVTSQIEHHAILNSCAELQRMGVSVEYLPVEVDGTVRPDVMRAALDTPTRLVSVMFANNEIGTIEPIHDLAAVAHERGALFHTDAVQAVGHVQINVYDLGVDFLSSSAHKFNGPKGIGFLFVRSGREGELRSLLSGGAQEGGHRAGTENVASIVGMAAALRANVAEMDVTSAKLRRLEEILLGSLTVEGVLFCRNGAADSARRIPGNISLSFPGFEGEALLHRLDLMGISVSTGSACDSQNTQISHVLKAIGLEENFARGTIRISLGRYNSEDDARDIAASLVKILK